MRYQKPTHTVDRREQGRVILAHGEVTGHCHEVLAVADRVDPAISPAEFFEEPDGRRILMILAPCVLRHQEHGAIALDPTRPEQVRQGDVLLQPVAPGVWEVRHQQEWPGPEGWRAVAD